MCHAIYMFFTITAEILAYSMANFIVNTQTDIIIYAMIMQPSRMNKSTICNCKKNKLTSIFHASVLLSK